MQAAEAVAHSIIGSSMQRQVILVCGSKNVGKSSFAKLLVNSLLNHASAVGYMDTDLGQPEFTPPGANLTRKSTHYCRCTMAASDLPLF